jgi:hypothetical protein
VHRANSADPSTHPGRLCTLGLLRANYQAEAAFALGPSVSINCNKLLAPSSNSLFDFIRYAAAPAWRSLASFFCDRLVSTITGICFVVKSCFSASRTSGPVNLGSIMSSSTRSGMLSLATHTARCPSSTGVTLCPALARTRSIAIRMKPLSSARSIFIVCPCQVTPRRTKG